MTETKQITLTGGAAEELGGGKKTRRARGGGSRKNKKLVLDKEGLEGGGTSPGTMTQLAASSVGSVNIQKVLPAAATVTDGAARVNSARPAVEVGLPSLPAQAQAAGAPVKVVLKPKKKTARVVLAPPKKGGGNANANAVEKVNVHPVAPANLSGGGKKTRKAIKVSLPGLNKKLTKAKTIRQDAAKTSVEQVKKTLHKAGLIKMDTKAPESILRQMYADFMVLKNRAL